MGHTARRHHASRGPSATTAMAVCLFILLSGTCAAQDADEATEQKAANTAEVTASAVIYRCDSGAEVGAAHLRERPSAEGVKEVDVQLKVTGITPAGKHAVHIHETGKCKPCSAAGGHFDPGPNSNTSPDGNHPFHAGDLVNIEVDDGGRGLLETVTTRVSLSDGPLSIFDADGSAFIVHVDPDSYCEDGEVAGCAGGGRLACGIIVRGQ